MVAVIAQTLVGLPSTTHNGSDLRRLSFTESTLDQKENNDTRLAPERNPTQQETRDRP